MKIARLLNLASITRALFLVLTISVLVSLLFPQIFPFTQDEAARWIKSYKHDKIAFVIAQIIQVIVPPISHYFTSMLGGYIYGPLEGGMLNLIGRVIGQFIAYGLAYQAAGWLMKKKDTNLEKFSALVAGNEYSRYLRALIIFAMIALPFFPDDELSYAMGFARFPVLLFALVTIFGHMLGSFALAFLGSGQEFRGPLFITLASLTLACFITLAWASIRFRKSLKEKIIA